MLGLKAPAPNSMGNGEIAKAPGTPGITPVKPVPAGTVADRRK
jgi:hypothetical protein